MKNQILSLDKLLNIFTIIFICVCLSTTTYASLLVDRIVAVVENDVITENELLERISVIRSRAGDANKLPSDNILAEQVLQRMIVERLQVEWGERRGIEIDDLTLDQAMRNLARRNNLNLDQFRNALIEQGIDYVAFRDQVRTEMMIGQVLQRAIHDNVQITSKEIEMTMEMEDDLVDKDSEYRLAHILIQLPQDPSASDISTGQEKINNLRDRATGGESFTQLAIAHSQAQDALEGGDLGWRNRNQLPEIFSSELAGMQPGEISPVLRSSSGFHIFRILDIRGNEAMMVDQLFARHILLRTNALRTDQQAEDELNSLRSRIVNGDDFGELARANSEDPVSAANGGELGWTTSDIFVPAFKQVADTIELGKISTPFKSRFGWHILQVLEKREHDNSSEAMKQQAREVLRQRKIEEETELWLRQLRDEAYVENRLTEVFDQ